MRRGGFTIIEVIVVLGILGVILSFVANFVTDTLASTTDVSTEATRLVDLKDVTGYVGDNVRRANYVYQSGDTLTVNGVSCALPNCLAMTVADTRSDSGTVSDNIQRYVFLAYVLVQRSAVAATLKPSNAWADTNTRMLLEYRQTVCSVGSANCPPGSAPTAVTGAVMSPVADLITLQGASGNYTPFAVAARAATIQIRLAEQVRGRVVYTPNDRPSALTVIRRN